MEDREKLAYRRKAGVDSFQSAQEKALLLERTIAEDPPAVPKQRPQSNGKTTNRRPKRCNEFTRKAANSTAKGLPNS